MHGPTWDNKAYTLVMQHLHEEGFVAYAVGGCVRDGLMGLEPKDVDVATNARPHDLPKVFGTEPWDGDNAVRTTDDGVALYPTGVSHGTWTVRIGDDTVEVTSFRKDVDTDGRRATVEFADTMEEDALRRDFTMNALYLDRQGIVHDPTGTGIYDLYQGHLRFVGDADERIKEDYLRILRLFRFHARFGRGSMNQDAWQAVERHHEPLLEKVSGERIWGELKKILSLPNPNEALWEMDATGVLHSILPDANTEHLGPFLRLEQLHAMAPDWAARYAVIQESGEIPFPVSRSEKAQVQTLKQAWDYIYAKPWTGLEAITHAFGEQAAKYLVLRGEYAYDPNQLDRGIKATMPLSAQDLLDDGISPGPELGKALEIAKEHWYLHKLSGTKEALKAVAIEGINEER